MLNYWNNKKVYKGEDDNWYLMEIINSFSDGPQILQYRSEKDIYLLGIESIKDTEALIPLTTFLSQNGYSMDDFKNPFGRTKRILSIISTINKANKAKVKEKK